MMFHINTKKCSQITKYFTIGMFRSCLSAQIVYLSFIVHLCMVFFETFSGVKSRFSLACFTKEQSRFSVFFAAANHAVLVMTSRSFSNKMWCFIEALSSITCTWSSAVGILVTDFTDKLHNYIVSVS